MSSLAEQALPVRPQRARSIAWYRRKSVRRFIGRTIALLIIIVGAAFVLFPVAWMISTSLKTTEQTAAIPVLWIPPTPKWQNYPKALTALPFGLFFRNTFIITVLSVIGTVFSGSVVGYGFARFRAPGRDTLFLLVLATLILPAQVTLIPQFILFDKLHWVNTFAPLIVPNFFGTAFNVFLMRQFFLTIPREMDEAATIDGANRFEVFYRVVLPLALPAVGIIAIFQFIYSWNDFFDQLIYLNSNNVWTVALGLAGFTASYGGTAWNLLMAASLVAVLPCIILFFFAQRYFVQGIVISGVK
jgi:ABC-type glycerol-3-phosphate transport system permease component